MVHAEWGKEGNRSKTHQITKTVTQGVDGTIASDKRVKNQITGYYLNGYTSYTSTNGPLPEAGDIVVDRQNRRNANGLWFEGVEYPTDTVVANVEEVSGGSGGLYVIWGAREILILP